MKNKIEKEYISVQELCQTYKVIPSLARMQLKENIPYKEKITIKSKVHYPFNHPVTKALMKYGQEGVITATTAKLEMKLTEDDLTNLYVTKVKNPHYAKGKPMRLFYLKEVKKVLAKRAVRVAKSNKKLASSIIPQIIESI